LVGVVLTALGVVLMSGVTMALTRNNGPRPITTMSSRRRSPAPLRHPTTPMVIGSIVVTLLAPMVPQPSRADIIIADSAGKLDIKSAGPTRIDLKATGNEILHAAAGERIGDKNDMKIVAPTTAAAIVAYPNAKGVSFEIPEGRTLKGWVDGAEFAN